MSPAKSHYKPIRAAVFPVAGRGTRFLPATKASPKEMLPIVDKPLIQYAAEEALSAGARNLVFITGSSKRAIEDHFDSDHELESALEAQGKHELLESLRGILPSWASCVYIRQPAPLGLGHAVLCARPVVGHEPFFVHLADEYATGSSMLPQKKNADIAELARGKAGRVIGDLTGLLATLKGLPLSYNRDLQEDKEPLFDAVDQVGLALGALAGLYRTLRFDESRLEAVADSPYLAATDLAELLVERGMPFRAAHALVGGLVRDSIERRVPLVELVHEHPDLGADGAELLEPGVPVARRTTHGGAGPEPVAEQLLRFEARLQADAARL